MIVNVKPYPLSFDMNIGQSLVFRYGEEGRQYAMQPDVDVSGLGASLQIVKPDNTFVIASADVVEPEKGPAYIVITIPLQATVVKGIGHYSIFIQDDSDMIIYSAEGQIWIDDHLITDDMIESAAEVYGLRFPQDFLTVDNLVDIVNYVSANLINDETIAENTTWSSQKIDQEISGIEPEQITATEQGNPIEITDAAAAPMVKCVTEIQGSQDLHGYDKPWPPGAGKNKLPLPAEETKNGVTLKYRSVGAFTITGSPASNTYFDFFAGTFDSTVYAGYKFYVTTSASSIPGITFRISGADRTSLQQLYNNTTILNNGSNLYFALRISYDAVIPTGGINIKTMMVDAEASDVFAPYSNICPITAYSTGTIEVEDGDGNTTTHTTTYPSAIYRGSEDVVNGTATTEWGMIASYAGETLPGDWISDRDEYAPGTTPTTGAQVAYELTTPTTTPVTPTNLPIKSLSGYTHIESSTGDMEVEYITKYYEPLTEIIERGDTHKYSTAEQVVGKWIDGSTVYERVIEYATPFTIANDTWYTSTESYTGISKIINAWIINTDGAIYNGIIVLIQNDKLVIGNQTKNQPISNLKYVILRYTKTS